MKTFILKITLLFLVGRALGAAEQVGDVYQKDVQPELVNKVNLAKDKQVDGADLKQAESLLSDVLKQKPDYYRALYNLGQVYESEGEHDSAIKTFEKAKEVRDREGIPDNSILNSLGWAYLKAGNLDKAEDYLRAAYKADTNERVLNNLGFLYLQKGQTVEARKYLNEAKDKFQSATAANLLKAVNDYERQNQMWAVYGQQPKTGGKWSERHFNVEGNPKTAIPKLNETVVAFENVYIRKNTPTWSDQIGDYVHGPIVGYIKPGDRVRALEVVDINPATDDSAWYWIRLSRLPKQ